MEFYMKTFTDIVEWVQFVCVLCRQAQLSLISLPYAYICTHTNFRLYNKMTMEVILSTAFGRAVDVQGGQGGKIYEAAVAVFRGLAPSEKENSRNFIRVLQFLTCKLLC